MPTRRRSVTCVRSKLIKDAGNGGEFDVEVAEALDRLARDRRRVAPGR